MNKVSIYLLKILRKVYQKINQQPFKFARGIQEEEQASTILIEQLLADKPCMIARLGSTELTCLLNYLSIKENKNKYLKYIKGECEPFWWNQNIMTQMQNWSGFFPADQAHLTRFCELMLQDLKDVDILGSWLSEEEQVDIYRVNDSLNVHLRLLEPFWSKKPWTLALKGKKVLVVHPFNETIEAQYKKRTLLFEKEVLPEFELSTIKAVQSLGGDSEFKTWFEALDFMKAEIDKVDYDVCLIGAGAYGFPLAAHVKQSGKKAVHLGGALQLLFGIKGNRWEDPNYGVKEWGINRGSYSNLMNKHWVRPGEIDKPKNAQQVEGACYW
ncbi:hypothetical protein MPF19_14110 [Polaribacter sp. Z014]|uniref:hypothetical protein n=1 Tax=Polaribacter sp. Z014 TaxID=2927126 RepID=UPI002020238F|nr:hypothetical protein [Polaribacter sp. Z014]MCL7764553.1 hypothetical protein [Polaribacter sp. Z014]